MKSYTIRYNHTSSQSATSMSAARKMVRSQMRQSRMCTVEAGDGLYCYMDKEDMDRDADGSRAFAVISAE